MSPSPRARALLRRADRPLLRHRTSHNRPRRSPQHNEAPPTTTTSARNASARAPFLGPGRSRANPRNYNHDKVGRQGTYRSPASPYHPRTSKKFPGIICYMASFSGYQRSGIYPWAHSRIIPAITEISRAAGLPGINMYCYQTGGIGMHRTGEACDFQAGTRARYAHSYAAHDSLARYMLQPSVWNRLRIRYVAWNGWEYINTPTNARRQTRNYGGSDPFHQNHVHVDFKPGSIPGAIPTIAIGGGTTPPPSSTSRNYYPTGYLLDGVPGPATYTALQRFLADRNHYSGTPNGLSDSKMWTAYQNFLIYMNHYPSSTPLGYQDKSSARGTQQWQKRTGYYRHNISANWDKNTWKALQTYLRYAHADTTVYPYQTNNPTPTPAEPKPPVQAPTPQEGFLMALTNSEQKRLAADVDKIKQATGRSEDRERDMLTALQQQNDLLLSILDSVNNLNPGN